MVQWISGVTPEAQLSGAMQKVEEALKVLGIRCCVGSQDHHAARSVQAGSTNASA
jgi:hypothetical protein